jgi:hypothetical protein
MLQEGNGSTADIRIVFVKLAATAFPYMGDRRTRGPLVYHDILLSRKENAVARRIKIYEPLY